MRRFTPRLLSLLLLLPALPRAGAAAENQGGVRIEIRDTKGAPVADAVASFVPLDAPPVLTPPAVPVAITQKGEEFIPFVTPVCVGTRVNFPNRDKVQHHVFSFSKAKRFDLPLYRGEPKETVLFDQPGVVSLGCNIHDWMSAYVVVLATPYFARSADDGLVPFPGLPAGRYRLEVWHPRIKAVLERAITVAPRTENTQVIAVTLGVDRRIRRAPESGAGGYK